MQRKRIVIAAILCAFGLLGVARANPDTISIHGSIITECGTQVCLDHIKTGDADLDRAVQLCDQHWFLTITTEGSAEMATSGSWEAGWELCARVMAEWSRSLGQQQLSARADREADDLVWLNKYAGALKP